MKSKAIIISETDFSLPGFSSLDEWENWVVGRLGYSGLTEFVMESIQMRNETWKEDLWQQEVVQPLMAPK